MTNCLVLLLIRKSISSLGEHIEKVMAQLPWYDDDDNVMSNHCTTSPPIQHKDTTMESMVGDEVWSLVCLVSMFQPENMDFAQMWSPPLRYSSYCVNESPTAGPCLLYKYLYLEYKYLSQVSFYRLQVSLSGIQVLISCIQVSQYGTWVSVFSLQISISRLIWIT